LRAVQYALRLVVADPYSEDAHYQVMRLYAASGRPDAVRHQFEELQRTLREELDEEPTDQTRQLADQLESEAEVVADQAGIAGFIDPAMARSVWKRRPALAAGLVCAVVLLPALSLVSLFRGPTPVPASASPLASESPIERRFRELTQLREQQLMRIPADRVAIQRTHAEGVLSLAEVAWSAWYGPDEPAWLSRLDRAHDDVRMAMRYFLQEDPAKSVQLAGALTRFWYLRNYAREGSRWLNEALAHSPDRTTGRARALVGASFLASVHDAKAEAQCREALVIYREHKDVLGTAHALRHLGYFSSERSHRKLALSRYEQALALFTQARDERGQAVTLLCMGFLPQPRPDAAHAVAISNDYMTRSLSLFRKIRNPWGVSMALDQLSQNAEYHRPEVAAALLEQVMTASPSSAAPNVRESVAMARLAELRKDPRKAASLRAQALEIARDQRDMPTTAWLLDWASCRYEGWPLSRAVRLRVASMEFDRSLGIRQNPESLALRRQTLAGLRTRMGSPEYEAAVQAGKAMTWDQAVDEIVASP
jgi:tetratricopeptide (TPR) repeat protein